MIHIHARRPDGTPSHAVDDFRAITDAIRAEVGADVIVNYSTGAVGVSVEERVAYLDTLRPEVAALNMGSMNYAKYSPRRRAFVFQAVFANPFDEIVALLEAMNDAGIKPEHECFDTGHVGSLAPLVDMGLLSAPLHASFVMGVIGGVPATARNLAAHGRQPAAGLALGRDRDLARAVDARRRRADARRIGARRPRGQPLPPRRHDGALERRPRREGARPDARRRAAPGDASPRRARCSASRPGPHRRSRHDAPARRRPRPRPQPPAAGAVLLAAARRLRRRRPQGRGHRRWATTCAGLRRSTRAPRRARGRRCSSRSTATSARCA